MAGIQQPFYHELWFFAFSTLVIGYSIVLQSTLALIGKSPVIRTIEPTISKRLPPRVALVTGSNTGIGFETARSLVVDHGCTVIMGCRSRDKAVSACERINAERSSSAVATKPQQQQGEAVFVHPLDLTSFDSVRAFAAKVKETYKKLDILVNNAGLLGTSASENNLDKVFQANFLGHFLLTSELMSIMVPQARVVNLSSVYHHFNGGVDVNSAKMWEESCYFGKSEIGTYPLSKLAAILFTIELNRRYGKLIRSIAVNPGAVNSDIWRKFPFLIRKFFDFIYLTNRQGCTTSVAASIVPDIPSDVIYLQPYWGPENWVPHPVMEMLGPYVGFRTTSAPRLPAPDNGRTAANALWTAALKVTGAQSWPAFNPAN